MPTFLADEKSFSKVYAETDLSAPERGGRFHRRWYADSQGNLMGYQDWYVVNKTGQLREPMKPASQIDAAEQKRFEWVQKLGENRFAWVFLRHRCGFETD